MTVQGDSRYARRLDDLILSLRSLWKRATTIFEAPVLFDETISQMRREALELDRAFKAWEETRESSFCPTISFHIQDIGDFTRCQPALFPGKVDTYLDIYTSAVWNVYRASRLLLLDLIVKLSTKINDGRSPDTEDEVAASLISEMISSIPFHLVEDLHVFSREIHTSTTIKNPGRAVGGLLLMHSISITSHLDIVDSSTQQYLKKSLRWIAENMGIGQASILARVCPLFKSHLSTDTDSV